MSSKVKRILIFVGRMVVTVVFLLSLFAINFDHPQDILSLTTLKRISTPSLLARTVHGNMITVKGLVLHANPVFIVLAFLTHLLCVVVLTHRWQLLLQVQQIGRSFYRLFAYYLMGFFFNNFLPTNIGGDIARVYNAGKHDNKMSQSFAAVFMERFVGFATIFGLAVLSMILYRKGLRGYSALYAVLLFAIGIALVFWALFDVRVRNLIKACIAKVGIPKVNERLTELHQAVYVFRGRLRVLLCVFLLSAFYQFLLIFVNYFSALAVNTRPSLVAIFFTIQITTLICLIPVSINGLGVRESFYMLFLSANVPDDNRIKAFLMILLLVNYVESLIGGFCFLLQKGIHHVRKRRTEEMAAIGIK